MELAYIRHLKCLAPVACGFESHRWHHIENGILYQKWNTLNKSMIRFDKEKMIELCNTAQSMAAAAEEMEMAPNTFRRHAMKLGCYKPNQAGIGVVKSPRKDRVITKDILDGNVPYTSTNRLKRRLLNEGYLTNECVECGIGSSYNGMPITLELDHVNGNRFDHSLSNLRILCPNCHSQTETFRFKGGRVSEKIHFAT